MLRKTGKRIREWAAMRAKLSAAFLKHGITRCESCGAGDFLTWAHARKRRLLRPGELGVVALLCQRCHQALEDAGHESMHRGVMRLIGMRKVQPMPVPESAWEV